MPRSISQAIRQPKAVSASKKTNREAGKNNTVRSASKPQKPRGPKGKKPEKVDTLLAETSSESEESFVNEKDLLGEKEEERQTATMSGQSSKTTKHSVVDPAKDENVPPPSKRRRSARTANKVIMRPSYVNPADSTDDEDDSDDDDDDSFVSAQSRDGAKKNKCRPGDVAYQKSKRDDKKAPKKPKKLPSPKRGLAILTTAKPLQVAEVGIRKPSPASSSIRDITSSMWQPNANDWRVESVMDY